MYLKKIEMHGFKSFADEVKLEFEPNITAIIGPNGSGKSNISDAIRWVLGEQSAKSLRGSKMEDVIFAGSDQRRPLGIAEVTLTLDNSDGSLPIDYNEVTIGRRVSRSGESDYLINNSVCRLKDVEELIMGTGMGKEAYSIIGQGKIDSILSNKSSDRRGIFEEAAGITKHKKRKDKASKKLEDTEHNLQRITDIIGELEKQVGPLKEDAKKAEKYNEYYTELEFLEVNLLLNRYSELDNNLTEVIKKRKELDKETNQIQTKVAKYDSKKEELNLKLDQITEKISLKKDNRYQIENRIERINNKIQILKEKRNNADYRLEQLVQEIKELKEEISGLGEELENNQSNLKQVNQELNEHKNYLQIKEEELDKMINDLKEKEGSKDNAKESMIEHLNQINKKRNQLDNVKRQIVDIEEEIIEKEEDKEKNEDLLKGLKEDLTEVEEDILTTKRQFKDQQREVKEKEEYKIKLQDKLQVLQDEYEDYKSKQNNYQSKLEVLEGMQEKYQGYYRGVKSILRYRKSNPDFAKIYGVVAELLTVPKKFETAIETALGSRLQNIIVDKDRDAKTAINYLKKNKAGRATFLPLNLVKPRSLYHKEEKTLKISGALGVAANIVDYKDKFTPVVKNLLGRIIIAKDMDAAVKISKQANQKVKVVTLDGETINPGGSMTGGSSYNKNANLLSRGRQIDELNKKVKSLDERLEEIGNKGLEFRDQIVNLEKEIKKKKNLIHQLDLDLTGKRKDYQQLEKEIDRLETNKEQLNNYSTALSKELESLRDEKQSVSKEIEILTDGNQNIEGAISSIENKIKQIEDKKEDYNEEITNLKVKMASIKQERINLEQEQKRLKDNIQKAKVNIKTKEDEIDRINKKKERQSEQKSSLLKTKENLYEEKENLKSELKNIQEERRDISERINELQQDSQGIRKKLNKVQKSLNDYEVQEAQLEVKLENIGEKLIDNYEVNIEERIDNREPIDNHDKIETRIKELKKSINKLGHVNLGAIEEYETLKERFDFMKEQHADLIEAKDSLSKVISEIDETMQDKFKKTFDQVKVEFEKIFIELFNGGKAELILDNPDDLLKTGVEINAQPPGKKLQKLSLMSGGEKALTATALIFSLLKVKPSPFYILDEIDAPLDDANVDRFAEYLNELSSIAQFVLITHRKGTMKIADALYGVTMQESGISKMVSLKLTEVAS
ncbi:chromosome segregation protein SMC [Selenihalanaerobacter shriftii]|uniref:Chromosome partition protein Smc n=1 Tax=Selenihalanaerobacter shriftii TaxID=142842 RepID=A0A1T4M897_9FIRM|nr:chromosome segregation protein SMC [Selenihalanaerobacter shriftii]SJZ63260.1 condensin subunit Smc [Selenihalanaerobacter shriftii]